MRDRLGERIEYGSQEQGKLRRAEAGKIGTERGGDCLIGRFHLTPWILESSDPFMKAERPTSNIE